MGRCMSARFNALAVAASRRVPVVVGLLALVGGCATSPPAPAPKPDLLAFLEAEHVTREEVSAQLGPPSAVFKYDHVVTYRLAHGTTGYYVVPPNQTELSWQGVDYDLVLAFNDDGTLREHRLIAVRAAPPTR
jgi:hypothetical protein